MMANETILPTPQKPTLNGQSTGEQSTKLTDIETSVLRAARILSGDIRESDYLPVSDDIISFVANAEAQAGVQMLPEYRQKMILDLALQAHHAGDIVLVRYTPEGVIVLEEGSAVEILWDQLTTEQKALVSFSFPATLI
jgi:hypothetical protein